MFFQCCHTSLQFADISFDYADVIANLSQETQCHVLELGHLPYSAASSVVGTNTGRPAR